jgi:1,2-diacylglycerol 3-beta-galactosyltransferase
MNLPKNNRRHILFIFSDTGGGHRSAAEAIIEALNMKYPGEIETDMVDIFKDYTPRPFRYMPEIYPQVVRVPQAWELTYHLSDGRRRSRFLATSSWPYLRKSIRAMVTQHPSDMIVSVHPLAIAPTLRALGDDRPPFITVVTDLVTGHALWFNVKTDLCIVPTEAARQRALHFGLVDNQIQVVGLPVAHRFCQPIGDKLELRQDLGWPTEFPIVILVGGGEGMGPLENVAESIANSNLPITLVVITGRNEKLFTRLKSKDWAMPTNIYGFVRQMPEFMRAADILITKAGPGTISEALNAHLPMILYSRLPGQEEGNVSYIVSQGAGVWAPKIDDLIQTLRDWIENPRLRIKASVACSIIARPQAANQIADILAERIGIVASPGV